MNQRITQFIIWLLFSALILAAPLHAAPSLFISNYGSNTVSAINTVSNTVTATIPVGASPYGLAVNPAGTRAYVTNMGANSVSVIDTATNAVVSTVTVGTNPTRAAVHPSGTKLYVSNAGDGTISIVNTSSATVTGFISIGGQPMGIQINPSGTTAYVANFTGDSIAVVDLTSNTVTATIPVGNHPIDLAVSPDGTMVYATNHDSNTVSVIATASNTVTTTIPVGSYPTGVWFNPAGTKAFITHFGSGNVMVFNPATNVITDTFSGFSAPVSIQGSPDGSRLYVVNQHGNNVSVLSAADYSPVTTIAVGSQPLAYNGTFIADPPPVTDGLVSLWKGENNIFDALGNNPGVWTGAPGYAPGIAGQAFSFDGTARAVTIPDSTTLDVTTSFTLAAWIKPAVIPTYPNADLIISKIGPVSNLYGYQMVVSNMSGVNGIWCGFNEAGRGWPQFTATGGEIPLNAWTHIACVYDHDMLSVYQNGVLVGSSTVGPKTVANSSSSVRIGSDDVFSQYYTGLIDEAMIYNRALTTKELLKISQAGSTTSWWSGEADAQDSIGLNHGVWTGVPAYGTGHNSAGFLLNGSNYVTLPDTTTQGTTDFTIGGWIKPSTTGFWEPVFEWSDGVNSFGTHLWVGDPAGNLRIFVNYFGGCSFDRTVTTNAYTWNHVALSFNSATGQGRLYCNGQEVDHCSSNGGQLTYPLYIGSRAQHGYLFNGIIDEIFFARRNLTGTELQGIVSATQDTTPDLFTFTAQSSIPVDTVIISNPVTVSGINYPASVSISNGEYQINGGAWTSAAGTVANGDSVLVRQTSSPHNSVTTTTTLTIDSISASFSVTTAAANDPHHTGLISWWRGENTTYDSIRGNNGIWSGTEHYSNGIFGNAFTMYGSGLWVNTGLHQNCYPESTEYSGTWNPIYNPDPSIWKFAHVGGGSWRYHPAADQLSGCRSDWYEWWAWQDGTSSHISFPDLATDLFENNLVPFSISFWVNAITSDSNTYLMGKSTPDSGTGFDLRLDSGKLQVIGVNGWGVNITSTTSLTTNTWYHVALTLSAAQASLYINGVLSGTSPRAAITPSSNPFRLGYTTQFGGTPYRGHLDEIKIFNRTLSADEIQQLNTRNLDFEVDPANTAGADIGGWDYRFYTYNDSGTLGTTPTADHEMFTTTARSFSGNKSVYSRIRTLGGGNQDANYHYATHDLTTAYQPSAGHVLSSVTLWRSDIAYTTSSRWFYWFAVDLNDGVSQETIMLACRDWGNQEGCTNNFMDTHDQSATGADGQTWYRHTIPIPAKYDQSTLKITVRHTQRSWDGTSAESSLYYDLLGESKIDTERPQVTTFAITPTESVTASVPVASFTASDNDTISGYLITTSSTPPAAADAGWSAIAPATALLPLAGLNTLYAWVKDPAGNVSLALTDSLTLRPVRRGDSPYSYYESFSAAIADGNTGETIKALAVTIPGNVTITGGKNLVLSGGYGDTYGSATGFTAIQGTVTVASGYLRAERIIIK